MNDFPLSRRVLHWFTVFTAVWTWLVLISGASVTSRNAGMAVPDWPTSFGYNMFLFPYSKWVGPIFYEHSHRLMASCVGGFVLVLVVALIVLDPRIWVKVLGVGAFCFGGLQGLLGGLRVVLNESQIGILHGILAQSLLVAISILAVVTSRAFVSGRWAPAENVSRLRWLALVLVGCCFVQLAVAATMRHAHAGLSIPDFPAAYGKFLPDTSEAALVSINAARAAAIPTEPPTTAELIWLQMIHRFIAAAILLLVIALAWRARRTPARRLAWLLLGMVAVQITLGMFTIWTNKAADVATAHMALGALTLVASALLTFRFFAMQHGVREESLEFSAPPSYSRVSA
ncbi:MAG TPA: COX15/CtaA family protein [Chthoniobacterales bacterium]|nr:COX15/CtaA family protein [Chthoniobacterales bacterium]